MKQSLSLTLSLLVGLIITAILAKYIGISKVISIFKINKIYLILFLITSFTIMFLRVLKWKFILESHQIKIPFWRLFMYRIAGFAVSFLTPSAHIGGEPVRAYLLTKHNVNATRAFSSVIIDKAIELTLNGAFTVAFLAFILLRFHFNILLKSFLLFNLLLILFLIILFYVRTINGKGFFTFFYYTLKINRIKAVKRIKNLEKHIREIDKNNTELFYQSKYYFPLAFTTHLLAWLLSLLEYQLILLMFNFKVSIITAFMVYAGTGFAYLTPLPGALGILEVVQSLVARLTGLPTQFSFGVSFIVRARDGLWTIIGIAYLYILKINLVSQILSNTSKNKKLDLRTLEKLDKGAKNG